MSEGLKLKLDLEFEINFRPDGKILLCAFDGGGNDLGNREVSIEDVFKLSTQIYRGSKEQTQMLKNINKAVRKLKL